MIELRRTKFLIVSIEALNKIFDQHTDMEQHIHQGNCDDCGCAIKIEISKTSGGYGMLGGVLCEPSPQNIVARCTDCYEKTLESIL